MTDDPRRPDGSANCPGCGAPMALGQRHCLACGNRVLPIPPVVARWLERSHAKAEQRPSREKPDSEPPDASEPTSRESLSSYMPTPQAAAVAVMALLAAGVILGAVTDQFAQSAGSPIVLVRSPNPPPELVRAPAPVEEEIVEEAAPGPPPAPEAAPAEVAPEAPEPTEEPEGGEPEEEKFELPPEGALPPVTHLFMIVLGDQGFEATFGKKSTSPYLSKELAGKGELLSNYYAVAGSDLANQIALLSGQGPTAQTSANCPEYADVVPGTVAPATVGTTEQVEGQGCVYPASTLTLPGQLAAAGASWKAYLEENGAPGQPPTCLRAWRDPFAYFHSLLDGGECESNDVGLDRLGADLKSAANTPSLSYIVPGACHDGSETPCAPGSPAGIAGAETFLKKVVPEIEESDAYKVGGMIAITFAQAPQSGPQADPSSCCGTPEYPNLKAGTEAVPPAPATGPVKPTGGGGRVGMLLISPYVLPGSVNKSGYYNHFSMLRSVEELFGLAPLGYAAEPAVVPFDESVYNNLES